MIAPEPITLPINVRAYVPSSTADRPVKGDWRHREPSEWTLVFDCETTTDAAQALRFGTYQVRKANAIYEAGLFHAPGLSDPDFAQLTAMAERDGLRLIPVNEFVDQVFYRFGYDLRGTVIGFNLPFDISRLAVRHGSARGVMHGGFTFQISADGYRPRVQVKHLSRRASLIQFAAPRRQMQARSQRKRFDAKPVRRGFFVDVSTLASALFSRSFTLDALGVFLKVVHPKLETHEHGLPLTEAYVSYAVRDVQTTWECFASLATRYDGFGLTDTPACKILSEASLGKAYLKAMGVKPWRQVQPDTPPALIGKIMSTFYGGRSEVRIRREVRQVFYCDFLSMYPTVCTLMRLWRFVVAQGMTWRDGTEDVSAFLSNVTLADLQAPDTWKRLNAIVRVQPAGNILPVRAAYDGEGQTTIGLNYLSAERPLWFTLADCIASKLLSGKVPVVREALIFEAGEPQPGLRPVAISGHDAYRVDPLNDDFYRRLIDLRQSVRASLNDADPVDHERLQAEQLTLKLAANATSYGVFAEINVKDMDHPRSATCHGPSGEGFALATRKDEEPGRYFHPLLATLITGAARLMLATTERLITDRGLDWAFCDTDSTAIAKPDDMDQDVFFKAAQGVCDWFTPLNPYDAPGPVLKVEAENQTLQSGDTLHPLFCFAVSAKRYALFNIGDDDRPILRKASAHGLGHFRAPYDASNPAANIPAPVVAQDELGVEIWQHDLWIEIVRAALADKPDRVNLDFHAALDLPAISRYAATTPALLKWFDRFNANRAYDRQLRPFGFLTTLFARPFVPVERIVEEGERSPRRRRNSRPIRPVAPFERSPELAALAAFDRQTGERVGIDRLQTYRAALADYHLHPEAKFGNGEPFDRGATVRRQVIASAIVHIGKEANRWEQQHYTGLDEDAAVEYGVSPDDRERLRAGARAAVAGLNRRTVAKAAGLSVGKMARCLTGGTADMVALTVIRRAAEHMRLADCGTAEDRATEAARLRAEIKANGLRATARRLGIDPSNLARKLRTGGERFRRSPSSPAS